ncbi:MAG: glycosyltransferase family 2 protein [Candidatus Omnitrophica bacterium]|nr:glycosyltransferase family 2 protein [Candidatus Omnitrophota bacterium]
MPSPLKLSIVVPCYNEEKNISLILEKFREILKNQNEIELILVDNGSSDSTGSAIDREIKRQECSFARKVTVAQNQGYGFGVMTGLRESQGGVLAWTHADLQTDPGDVLRAYRLYQNEAKGNQKTLVKGYRVNRKISEKIISLGMQTLACLILHQPFSEINAQPKLFPRELLQWMNDPPNDFSLDLYLLWTALKNGFRVFTIPVYFKERIYGEAKGGAGNLRARWDLIQKTFKSILNLKQRA